jgi:hypothetical protein
MVCCTAEQGAPGTGILNILCRCISRSLPNLSYRYPWELDGRPLPEDLTIIFVLGGPGSGKSTQVS